MKQLALNRRKFISLSGLAGAGLVLGLSSKAHEARQVANLSFAGESFELTPYVVIEKNGTIIIYNTKPEIGQGVYQSIPAIIAEELEVSLDQVTIKQSGGEKKFGEMQFAGGSMSVRSEYENLRKVGASGREMLIAVASEGWGVPSGECYASAAKVFHKPSGKSVSYAALAEKAAALPVPQAPKLKDAKDFKILGKPSPRPDVPLKSSGKAIFGIDVSE
ncbi:MAG: molybdopterin-dependent oxidoreductase [Chitinophagaceae bacterium]|nr:molybdopterin-dependent oxidoreductase [Chitinophagaceae bacterium]